MAGRLSWARTRGNLRRRVVLALMRDMTRGKRLGQMSPAQMRDIAERINQRPMKTHQWRSRNQAAKPL